MPAEISEDYLSRPFSTGPQGSRELVYHVRGTDDEEEVEAALRDTAPATYLDRMLDSISAEPVGPGLWKGYARYTALDTDSEWTFDTGGGTVKLTQSIATVATYASPYVGAAPDFRGAIGVAGERVEGVDVPVPQYEFTETHKFTDAQVDDEYKYALFTMTGRINDAAFRMFAAGEVLFLGASGSKRGSDLWTITFRFAASPNATGLAVGDIGGIDKLGWDYLWVLYGTFEDTTAVALVQRPIAAYVERVHQPGDFATLGIGTE